MVRADLSLAQCLQWMEVAIGVKLQVQLGLLQQPPLSLCLVCIAFYKICRDVLCMQRFIQRVGNLGIPTPKLKFPPSSFADFFYYPFWFTAIVVVYEGLE